MTYRALLIGNSTFEADASLNPLNAPTKDVARLHRALVDNETGLFDDEHVRLVTERTAEELLDEMDIFFASAHRDDLLLLYYSGHGLLDERNQLFLCGRKTRSDRLLVTAVSNVRINEFIAQSVARCTVIVLDCCSSGMFKGGEIGQQLAGPGRYVVSSTRGSALANDAATATGTSLFTEFLVAGLLGEAEDRNGDGFVDLREIYDFVRNKLTATTKQVPHCRFDGDAEVTLARRRTRLPVPPPISKMPRSGQRGHPTFVLSENVITLRDIDPDERLGSEIVEIYAIGDADTDCTAETDANWLRAEVHGERVVIDLNPREGPNRSKIMIRDRRSGTAQVLRVEAYVRRRSLSSPPPVGVPTKGGAAPPDTSATQEVRPQTESPAAPPPSTPQPPTPQPPSPQPPRPEPARLQPASPQPPRPEPGAPQQPVAQQPGPKPQPPWPPQQGRAQVPRASQQPTPRPQEQQQPTWPASQHEPQPGPPPRQEPAQQPPWPQQQVSPQGQAPQPGWPPPGQGQQRSPRQPTNSKAMAAFITAVVAFILAWIIVGGLLGPVALVLASKASKQMRATGQLSGRGLVLAARIFAWAAIAVCALGIFGLILGG